MNKNLADILLSLRPGAKFVTRGNVDIEWFDDEQTQPTQAEIDAERERLQADYDSKAYARSRAAAYASTGDQLDMQYWDALNSTTTWADHIARVKEAYPK